MIRDIKGPVRRFDIIGYGEFEALLRKCDTRWLDRLREVVIGIDVSRPILRTYGYNSFASAPAPSPAWSARSRP